MCAPEVINTRQYQNSSASYIAIQGIRDEHDNMPALEVGDVIQGGGVPVMEQSSG